MILWNHFTTAGVRSSGAAYGSQGKELLRENDQAEFMSRFYWHLRSKKQMRERCGLSLRACRSIYTQHDPNPEVPWWVLVFCSLSLYDPVHHWNMVYLRSLNCVIYSGRKGSLCNPAWSTPSTICLRGLLLPQSLYLIVFNLLTFVYLW